MFRRLVKAIVVAEVLRGCSKGPFKFASKNHVWLQHFLSVQLAIPVVEDVYGEFA